MKSRVIERLKYNSEGFHFKIAGPLVLLFVWAGLSGSGFLPAYLLPSPFTVCKAVVGFVSGIGWKSPYAGRFWSDSGISMLRVITGFSLAAFFGISAGVACGWSRRLAWFVGPIIQLMRSVPGISWLPIAIIWFGIGTVTTVFLIALAAFFPVYINTLHGVYAIPPIWLKAGMTLGANQRQLLWRVVLPGAFPAITSGLRVALGVSWAYVVLGELTGVDKGLGAMIMDARMMGDVTTIIVGMISISVLGYLCDIVLMGALRRLQRQRYQP